VQSFERLVWCLLAAPRTFTWVQAAWVHLASLPRSANLPRGAAAAAAGCKQATPPIMTAGVGQRATGQNYTGATLRLLTSLLLSTPMMSVTPLVAVEAAREQQQQHYRGGLLPRCSCADVQLCKPLPHGTPAHDIHVYSDCGGPWVSAAHEGNTTSCDWRNFDYDTITTLVRMHHHPLTVDADGAVDFGARTIDWVGEESRLLCHAHAHGVRVLLTVLPARARLPKPPTPDPMFYRHLMGNHSAVQRMAKELAAVVVSAGFDGVEFDFESIEREQQRINSSFDFGRAHVEMIRTTVASFRLVLPHATVALTIGGTNLSSPLSAPFRAAYPVREHTAR
jgi:hypothetical protein